MMINIYAGLQEKNVFFILKKFYKFNFFFRTKLVILFFSFMYNLYINVHSCGKSLLLIIPWCYVEKKTSQDTPDSFKKKSCRKKIVMLAHAIRVCLLKCTEKIFCTMPDELLLIWAVDMI